MQRYEYASMLRYRIHTFLVLSVSVSVMGNGACPLATYTVIQFQIF